MRHNSGFALLTYMLLGFLAFHSALRIGFLGDFASDLYLSQNNWFYFKMYEWNFYVPAMMLYDGLYKIFHLYPLPYHAFHLSLICFNAWLVFLLARELRFEPWQCWLAGLLALFNSPAFEAYFWLSTIPKALTTACGLAALIFLARRRRTGAPIWGRGYLVMVGLGMTLDSLGLILPLMGLCLDTCYRPWRGAGTGKAPQVSGLRLHLWSFAILGLFLVIRQGLGIRPYVINMPLTQKLFTLTGTISNTLFHRLPDLLTFLGRGSTPVSIMIILGIVTLVIWVYSDRQGPDRRRFITLLLLWLGACLPHTIGANFQSRYLYFPGIFAALVVAEFFGAVRTRLKAGKPAWVFIAIVIAGYLITDLHAFRQSLSYYMDATRIYDTGIKTIRSNLPAVSAGTRLVLIDFPDSIRRPRTSNPDQQGRQRILIYRNGLPSHLYLLYQNSGVKVIFAALSPPNDNDNPSPLGNPVGPDQLAQMLAAPHTTAFRYIPGNPANFVLVRKP